MEHKWKCLGAVPENVPVFYLGVNLWGQPRVRTGEKVELPHPNYPKQLHSMRVYRSEVEGKTIVYAVAELSANVYGFYVAV